MSEDRTAPAGRVIAHYRVLAPLGRGAMGVVVRALDLDLGREVALKLLPAGSGDDPALRERLVREARNASRLNHPGICTVHEVGRVDGEVYVAMELVEGRPLRGLIPPGGLPPARVACYGAEIARALAHAHGRGVLHRDLKSANVMVTPDGHAKLLDFGLSRATLEESAGAAGGTSTGVVAGTPQYLAPEVLEGGRSTVASEVWSLGVLLHEMCAGQLPFASSQLAGVLTAVIRSAPAPLPEHVPAGLRAVILRCLEKDPARRWSSAGEVAAALEALGPGAGLEPAAARPGARRRIPARRVVTAIAFVALAAVAAFAAWGAWGPGASTRALERTVLILPMEMRGAATDPRFTGRAFSEALAVGLAQYRRLRVMPVPEADELPARGTLDRARAALRAGAGRLVVGSLTREGDTLRASVSLVDTRENEVLWGEERAVNDAELALLASSIAGHLADELGTRPLRRYDYFMYVTGPPAMAASPELAEALGAVRRYEAPQALQATARLVERFPREPDAHVLRSVALLLAEIGGHAPPGPAIEEEIATLRRLDPSSPWPEVGLALRSAASPRAELLARVARRDDLTPAARGFVLASRADALLALGDSTGALAAAAEAVRLDPASDLSLTTEARVLSAVGRYAEAAARVRQGLALNPTVANYWHQLGNCVLKQGRWADYVADLDRAAALRPEDPNIPAAQADGLAALGRHAEAAEAARHALALEPGASQPGLLLGLAQMRLGRWEEALPSLDRACAGGVPLHCGIAAAARLVVRLRAGDRARAAALEATARGSGETKSIAYALACAWLLRGDRDSALAALERFPGRRWVEPALGRDPNFARLRGEPRFRRVVAWMEAQPIARTFEEWGRSR